MPHTIRHWLLALAVALLTACSEDTDEPEAGSNDFTLSVMSDRIAAYGQTINLVASADSNAIDSWSWEYLGAEDILIHDPDAAQAWFVAPSDGDVELDFSVRACQQSNCQSQQTSVSVRDVAIVSLSSSATELAEPDGELPITLEINQRQSSEVNLSLAYTGTASNGEHFSAPASLSLPANSWSTTFTIAVIDDQLDSADSNVSVVVAASEQVSWSDEAVTFTIINDDHTPLISSSPVHTAYSDSLDTGYTVVGYDADADSNLSFAISGGADASFFSLDATSDAISFKSSPVLDPPQDANADNTYQLTLSVSDGANTSYGDLNINLVRAPSSSAQDATSTSQAPSPLPLSLTPLSADAVAINWQLDSSADWYALYRRHCPTAECENIDWQLRAQNLVNSHVDPVTAGAIYQYKVHSYSGAKAQRWSLDSNYYAPTQALNDSGARTAADQQDCPELSPAQDCSSGRDHLARSGNLAKQGSGDQGFDFSQHQHCLIDHTTGLHWQRHSDDQPAQRLALDPSAWQAAVAAANAQALCGHQDWRVPGATELLSLVDFGNQSMQENWFTDDLAPPYWSSDNHAQGAAYLVSARGITTSSTDDQHSLRLVRSEPTDTAPSFQLEDGSVVDTRTGLNWQACAYGQNYHSAEGCSGAAQALTWQQAASLVEVLNQLNGDNWRIPNSKELLSLFDPSSNAIDTNVLPHSPQANYWTSTPSTDHIWVWQQLDPSPALKTHPPQHPNTLLLVR